MEVFDCSCSYRFIVGKKQVYGPIYAIGLPGHYTGPHGCHARGRMMSREDFAEQYSDCAFRFHEQRRADHG